ADRARRATRCHRIHATVLFLGILEARLPSTLALPRVENHVDRHPVQPGAERALSAEEMQLLPRPNEDILRQLLGAQPIRHHARAEREHPIDVLTIEALECLPIPRSG